MILEAVASHDLRIWHAYFGVAGSNNDINVLNQSMLFIDTVGARSPAPGMLSTPFWFGGGRGDRSGDRRRDDRHEE